MKITRYLFLAFAVTAVLSLGAQAQARKPVRKPATSTKAATLPPLDVRAARVKVSNQLANVTVFIERLGPIAQAIEAVDTESRTKKLNKQSLDKNVADKQKVATAIRGLREGMVKLESEFRNKPALKKYLPTIQGISTLAGQAEDSAVAGRLTGASTPLRSIQQKLNDTLMAMPNVEL